MTVDDCKEDCRSRDDCVGVDFDSDNKCWYHTESTIGNIYEADYVDQYTRKCEPGRIGLYLGVNMNTADKIFLYLSIHGLHRSTHTRIHTYTMSDRPFFYTKTDLLFGNTIQKVGPNFLILQIFI